MFFSCLVHKTASVQWLRILALIIFAVSFLIFLTIILIHTIDKEVELLNEKHTSFPTSLEENNPCQLETETCSFVCKNISENDNISANLEDMVEVHNLFFLFFKYRQI